MKKSKSMRAAGALLVATLLSTSAVSGTYAKYVTSDSGSDTARVAKFGVVVAASGSLFSETYIHEPEEAGTTGLTVVSSSNDNVVAPGTNSGDGLTFSITGTPEVATKIVIDVTDADGGDFTELSESEIWLKKAAALPDVTNNTTDTFALENDYYPVQFTLTKPDGSKTVGTLAEIEAALEGLSTDFIEPNTDLSTDYGTYTLTWAWAFGNDDDAVSGNDKADTLLGDLAAGTGPEDISTLEEGTDYNLDCGIQIKISVVQVD